MNNLRDLIEAIVLENAIKFGGKPSLDAVIKKLIGIKPEYSKGRIKELIPLIKEVIEVVSQMSLDTQRERFKEVRHLLPSEVKKEIKYELPPLPNAEYGKVVTRFAPNPDFVLHLGSLRPLTLSYYYARMYDGRFILRFEDTDPRTKKPEERYYKAILDDLKWLGMEPDEIYYQSERLEIYYKIAFELLRRGRAYICLCKRDEFKKYILNGQPCPHREQDPDINLDLFNKMLAGEFNEGEAVLRIKTDLNHPNPSVRDWPAMRVINPFKYPHPRVGSKYWVWPLYNFSCAIDDHLMGITHVFRGGEHKINEIKQLFIFKHMGWSPPTYIHHGRLAIPEGILSKSKILKGIKEGIYEGFDDLRLATLAALRRRGFRPEALKNIMIKIGLRTSEATIDWSMLAAENRRIIDPIANRYFGVRNPVRVAIPLNKILQVKIRKHPNHPERGERIIEVKPYNGYACLYIDYADREYILSKNPIRLIHLGNYKLEKIHDDTLYLTFLDNDVKKASKLGYQFIHWVPDTNKVNIVMHYPGVTYRGYAEFDIVNEEEGAIVQLERIGYFKIESIRDKNTIVVIYTHE